MAEETKQVEDRVTKALVKNLLEHPETTDWTLQGFGMLRCYLEPELRLHVWDSRFRAEGVSESDTHTHPWDFHSLVVAGVVRNHRLREVTEWEGGGLAHKRQTIRCGVGGCLVGEPEDVRLADKGVTFEVLREGDTYTQEAREIHRSVPEDGTVTVEERLGNEVMWTAGYEALIKLFDDLGPLRRPNTLLIIETIKGAVIKAAAFPSSPEDREEQ